MTSPLGLLSLSLHPPSSLPHSLTLLLSCLVWFDWSWLVTLQEDQPLHQQRRQRRTRHQGELTGSFSSSTCHVSRHNWCPWFLVIPDTLGASSFLMPLVPRHSWCPWFLVIPDALGSLIPSLLLNWNPYFFINLFPWFLILLVFVPDFFIAGFV